ncbi:hypothetical protein AMELA_G00271420 [Ameiurus melas]|uniref:SEA domain-containing protein n=1 Tax=Ameiurus melas TaxID=219545 RepID=A0A7J5ZLF3_AMEME|nr:hypothetical protein AMELA_G00271420 [Ameiurus melas]
MKINPLPVLLVLIGLLGPSSDNNQLFVHGWRRTDDGLVIPDPQDLNTTAFNSPVNMLNSVTLEALNNGTDVKLFREGSQIIVRRYWYPYLAIVLKQSPATTASTTPAPPPTDFTTKTITMLTKASTEMTSTAESPSQASTAPYSTAKDLQNSLSAAFQLLALQIEVELDFIYRAKYSSRYSHSKVNSFQKGSVKVNATLFFVDTLPPNPEVESALISGWANVNSTMPLVSSSVVVGQAIQTSSSPREVQKSSTVTLLLTCVLLILQTLSLI